ncbi:MAG: alpha-glucuronidase, partial [Clostridia bacterium]|nr:alpha-glucuronidase [Clostridia bacterium]
MHYAWLNALPHEIPATLRRPLEVAAFEADAFFAPRQKRVSFSVESGLGEAYRLEASEEGFRVTGGEIGVLYGAYALIRARQTGGELPRGVQRPHYPLRMVDCWDNMDGSIERGYAGRSLWFEEDEFRYDPRRIRQLGRMLASCGVNVLCVNNVNVIPPAQHLIDTLLPEMAAFADILRPFGVRLMVSVDFSMPMQCGLSTADPLDEGVQAWWGARAREIWTAIPDLAGFLVKADSEHRPGPATYGRNHAQGANMLARAIAPYGGQVVWRAFVYNCLQDWRDTETDRPCAAYDLYKPMDGQFDGNVILQVKNGPYDFQVREPVSPLFYAMPRTRLALEFQLAQEYTGHQIDIYAMPPLWREVIDAIGPDTPRAIAAVSNLGRDENWTGHPFALLNLYAYGRFAWEPDMAPEAVIREWIGLTYGDFTADQRDELTDLLLGSRETYEMYTAPLGLCWMVNPAGHYGPSPYGYEFQSWGTYNRADRNAVGIDRTAAGTGYVNQYPPEIAAMYADSQSCPDNLLLFFHRLPYDFVMRDGRTLIQRIYDDHFAGYDRAAA